MAGSSNAGSANDIPPAARSKSHSVDSESNDDEEEEEYVVEKILGHEYDVDEGTFKYEVKWDGWEDTTWEPLENLAETHELKRYHKSLGGPPTAPKFSKIPKTSTKPKPKKRKLDEDTPQLASDSISLKPNKHSEVMGHCAPATLSNNWEEDIVQVETLEQDFKAGVIIGYVQWTNGEKSRHTLATLNKKCPQQMLRFYEAHLQFNQSTSSEARGDNSGQDTSLSVEKGTVKEDAASPPQLEPVLT